MPTDPKTHLTPPLVAQLIAQLPPRLQPLAMRGEVKRFAMGASLIREGEMGDTLFIILDGKLRAFTRNLHGDELTFGIYRPGEYVGEMSLDHGPRSAHVEAYETAICAVVTRQTVLFHIAAEPEFAMDLLAKVIRRARAATLSAASIALNDVSTRLYELFEKLAEKRADGTRIFRERLSQRALAALVGCRHSMVSKVLKDLETKGCIARHDDGTIVLVRPMPERW